MTGRVYLHAIWHLGGNDDNEDGHVIFPPPKIESSRRHWNRTFKEWKDQVQFAYMPDYTSDGVKLFMPDLEIG